MKNSALFAPFLVCIAVTMFSFNDVTMKFLSGGYALHELVAIRSVVGLMIVFAVMVPLSGGLHVLKTKRFGQHMLRALFVFFANITFFLGIAALPLADAVAIFFIVPFLVTIFSVVFLNETVGPRRWAAVMIGLLGVLIVLRPGTSAFQMASLFPLAAAFGYAGLNIMTRMMRGTDNAVAMVFYIQIFFLVACIPIGLIVGDGRFDTNDNASLSFLFRPWVWPVWADIPLVLMLGVFASIGGYFISQAYRLGEAAYVAPFEYLALPLSVLLGVLVFGVWPDTIALCGIALILISGLYTVWREHQLKVIDERNQNRPL